MSDEKDFIPAPAGGAPAPTATASPPSPAPALLSAGLDTTRLVIAAAVILVLALALIFVRSGIKGWLVGARATVDAASFAGTAWYVFLMLLSSAVVFGLIGGFFHLASYTGATAALGVIGLVICAMVTGGARKSRK